MLLSVLKRRLEKDYVHDAKHENATLSSLNPPKEALASLTGHGVEVEARSLVPAHSTDPWGIAVELIGSKH